LENIFKIIQNFDDTWRHILYKRSRTFLESVDQVRDIQLFPKKVICRCFLRKGDAHLFCSCAFRLHRMSETIFWPEATKDPKFVCFSIIGSSFRQMTPFLDNFSKFWAHHMVLYDVALSNLIFFLALQEFCCHLLHLRSSRYNFWHIFQNNIKSKKHARLSLQWQCSEFSNTRSFSQSPCIQSISCRAILSAVDFSTALSVCRSAIATWQRNSVWFVTLRYDYENLLTAAVSQSVSCCRVEISGEKKKVKPSDNGRVTGVGNRWTFLENGG
jgi:hypothetical protein